MAAACARPVRSRGTRFPGVFDILGIFGALRATGQARSTSPGAGEPAEIHVTGGTPGPAPLVLFLSDDDHAACCTSMCDGWCPNSNFFRTTGAAP